MGVEDILNYFDEKCAIRLTKNKSPRDRRNARKNRLWSDRVFRVSSLTYPYDEYLCGIPVSCIERKCYRNELKSGANS